MGGSPVSGGVSARTYNRNFEGRSGTKDAKVYLVSPQTAAMAALRGEFTDPATWGDAPQKPELPAEAPSIRDMFIFPPEDGSQVTVTRGPNIVALEDNITTDHILPAGAEITALRSNIPAISNHVFGRVDEEFVARIRAEGQGIIVGGENYGQGSSREHAALGPRHLGVKAVVVKSLARIHRANLVNFGILPLFFVNAEDYDKLALGEELTIPATEVTPTGIVEAVTASGTRIPLTNDLSPAELDIVRAGGLLNFVKNKRG